MMKDIIEKLIFFHIGILVAGAIFHPIEFNDYWFIYVASILGLVGGSWHRNGKRNK